MQPTSKTTLTSGTESIVFFGSGDVAASSLELLAKHQTIEAVITKPQPPHHKQPFPVLAVAERLGLQILTTTNKQALISLFEDRPVTSRLGVVIDYGIIIPQSIINSFELGIINSHFSLLPEWRGADPISFAILSGQTQTGVSLMLIVEALDEGPLLSQGVHEIPPDATTPSLTAYLVKLSDQLLRHTLPAYIAGTIKAHDQTKTAAMLGLPVEPTYSHKLSKQDSVLDWQKPASVLERQVRAYAGWPRSRCTIGTTAVIVTAAHVAVGNGVAGTIHLADQQLGFYCADNILVIDRLIPVGKKEMPATDFLRGYKP